MDLQRKAVHEARKFNLGLLKPGARCPDIFAAYNDFMRKHDRPEENSWPRPTSPGTKRRECRLSTECGGRLTQLLRSLTSDYAAMAGELDTSGC